MTTPPCYFQREKPTPDRLPTVTVNFNFCKSSHCSAYDLQEKQVFLGGGFPAQNNWWHFGSVVCNIVERRQGIRSNLLMWGVRIDPPTQWGESKFEWNPSKRWVSVWVSAEIIPHIYVVIPSRSSSEQFSFDGEASHVQVWLRPRASDKSAQWSRAFCLAGRPTRGLLPAGLH